ncbi:MAG: NAD(P)H-hydrate dehydratase [bacterium]|nr:NAD(P)H-hydrate dehydratase [bacterium]
MKVSTVEQMRKLDQTASDQFGIPELILMENAGLAAFQVLQREIEWHDKQCLVLCGVGNNGGDGFVIARKIHSNGGAVKVYILGELNAFKGAAKANLDMLSNLPIDIQPVTSVDSIASVIEAADIIVDAIFGTGLSRQVSGLFAATIDCINTSDATVLSVDIPSGVHGNTGVAMGSTVQADYTVTFGLPKLGNLLYPGYAYNGKLFVSHISFPPQMYSSDHFKIAINTPPRLPPRPPHAHKGTFCQLLVIAGAANYFGAPYFAALSFLKAGGGYVRLASPASMTPFIANKGSEIVFHPQAETDQGSIALTNRDALLDLSQRMDMVIIGPGLSLQPETQELVRQLTPAITKPLLIDGDGITAVCQSPELINCRQADTILTPHVGEMSRLINQPIADLEVNKIALMQKTTGELNATIVLKGAHSLIGYPDGRLLINMSGNSGMATAGSGDVLTGTIAAMFGSGLCINDAVSKGVLIHGLAGDLAAQQYGEDGLTAEDILACLPHAVRHERSGLPCHLRQRYQGLQVV